MFLDLTAVPGVGQDNRLALFPARSENANAAIASRVSFLAQFGASREEGETAVLDHILKFMTLGTLIVSSVAIYTALHTNNRRLGADIFLKYADRVSNLRRSLPTSAFFEGDASGNTEMTPEERRAAHEMIHSIFELYELKVHGLVPPAIWRIREPDMERLLSLPVFRQELAALQGRFARHPRFAAWIEQITQASAQV